MTALSLLALCVLVSLILFAAFTWVDAKAAFDNDPDTHTASERIKHWRRLRRWRAVLLAGAICALAAIPVYLFLHLVLEVV